MRPSHLPERIFLKKFLYLETFAYLCKMRKIITYGGYFQQFIESLNPTELKKVDYVISLMEQVDRMPKKFVKYIKEGLYELRVDTGNCIYRIFFIFDEGNIVVLFNGFQKKTQKTPKKEITKALKIKEAYYADKQSSNR